VDEDIPTATLSFVVKVHHGGKGGGGYVRDGYLIMKWLRLR
jgi:hypothetical protein